MEKVKVWMVLQRGATAERRCSKWLLRRQRRCCLGSDSSLYIRRPQTSSPHFKITIQFRPHEGISSSPCSFNPPFISPAKQQNGNNNTQQCNNRSSAAPSFFAVNLQPPLNRLWDLFESDLFSGSQRLERDTSESCKECHWQVLVWSHLGELLRRAGKNNSDARISASVSCCRRSRFWITVD